MLPPQAQLGSVPMAPLTAASSAPTAGTGAGDVPSLDGVAMGSVASMPAPRTAPGPLASLAFDFGTTGIDSSTGAVVQPQPSQPLPTLPVSTDKSPTLADVPVDWASWDQLVREYGGLAEMQLDVDSPERDGVAAGGFGAGSSGMSMFGWL